MEQIVKAIIENAVQQAIGAGASQQLIEGVLRSSFFPNDVDQWIVAACDQQPGEAVLSAELYNSYRGYGGVLNKQTFGRALTARGFLRKTRNDGCYWYGLILKGTSYRDGITNWIAADCTIHPYARLSSKTLHAAFCKWFGRSISKQQFNAVLDDCGYVREGNVWRGLTTKAALMTDRQLLEQERAAAVARINQGA
jgi:hypothetical protein